MPKKKERITIFSSLENELSAHAAAIKAIFKRLDNDDSSEVSIQFCVMSLAVILAEQSKANMRILQNLKYGYEQAQKEDRPEAATSK